jgi:hypothetical protein
MIQKKLQKTCGCIVVALSLFLLAGCGSAADSPDFSDTPANADTSVPGDSPAVDEHLSEAAWQQRIVYHVGPVDLPANTEAALNAPISMRFQADEPIWVTAFEPRVVDADGSELPPTLLHHAIILNMHEDNPLCSDAAGGDPIFVATSLLVPIELPQGYGYPILATDPIEARVILQNPTDASYAGVSFELTLVARPMNEFANLADVKPMLVEPDPCGHAPLEVEPGSFVEKTATSQMLEPAVVIAASGVLGDFGAAVDLTAGKDAAPFWRAEAELDDGHRLITLSDNPFIDPKGVALKAGDALTLGVTYDNASKGWLRGALAGAMVYLAIEE